eukprot:CAMPEP_0175951930 /NCGR_PEP_ID=MMETSP0108-20121206/30468_1 /TAXON_ID=195067 ORGANISM="Goniomonas pacifica, Strain CCMP1869" /NCGR_SAMPLE_ID=MMETSP0108 /ASSEMBLY_ACC=CAM_ASM_000204 /LENGTH=436 /DNA_ID=CAMNT_0017278233 /DNA_START=73 /DNA_END=1384 /DNA_ORIENTATION=-
MDRKLLSLDSGFLIGSTSSKKSHMPPWIVAMTFSLRFLLAYEVSCLRMAKHNRRSPGYLSCRGVMCGSAVQRLQASAKPVHTLQWSADGGEHWNDYNPKLCPLVITPPDKTLENVRLDNRLDNVHALWKSCRTPSGSESPELSPIVCPIECRFYGPKRLVFEYEIRVKCSGDCHGGRQERLVRFRHDTGQQKDNFQDARERTTVSLRASYADCLGLPRPDCPRTLCDTDFWDRVPSSVLWDVFDVCQDQLSKVGHKRGRTSPTDSLDTQDSTETTFTPPRSDYAAQAELSAGPRVVRMKPDWDLNLPRPLNVPGGTEEVDVVDWASFLDFGEQGDDEHGGDSGEAGGVAQRNGPIGAGGDCNDEDVSLWEPWPCLPPAGAWSELQFAEPHSLAGGNADTPTHPTMPQHTTQFSGLDLVVSETAPLTTSAAQGAGDA